jgi:hypothetical protein
VYLETGTTFCSEPDKDIEASPYESIAICVLGPNPIPEPNSDQTVRPGGNTQPWIRLRIVDELPLLYEFGNGDMTIASEVLAPADPGFRCLAERSRSSKFHLEIIGR